MGLHRLRRNLARLSRVNAALFLAAWALVAATPCVMAMQAEAPASHDCLHCPPPPCHDEAGPADCEDCDPGEPADRLRAFDASPFALAAPVSPSYVFYRSPAHHHPPRPAGAQAREGPRRHLLDVRFDE